MSLRVAAAWAIVLTTAAASAEECRVERLEAPLPEGVAPAIAERLTQTCYKVTSGKRTVCEQLNILCIVTRPLAHLSQRKICPRKAHIRTHSFRER